MPPKPRAHASTNQKAKGQGLRSVPAKKARVAIVLANYDTPKETKRCLETIARTKQGAFELQVVIIDNSERRPFPDREDATLLRPGKNIGLGGAWHRGYQFALSIEADYCLFLNNDAYLEPDTFLQFQETLFTYGPDTVLGPRIVHADAPQVVWSRGGSIDPMRVKVTHLGEGVPEGTLETGDFETGHLSGCCLFVPMTLLREIGGPDDRYFFRGEEWDLNHRLAEAGARLVLCDRARCHHAVNKSHDRFSPRMLYFAYRAKVLFARKHHPAIWFFFWYLFGIAYAAILAPLKFLRMSHRPLTLSAFLATQMALLRAFFDGLRKGRIAAADYPR